MKPGDQPRNDNWNPARGEPPEPGLFSTRKRAIESTLSLIGLAGIYGGGYLYLSPEKWQGMWITIGIAFVGMLVAGIYRLIVHGRA